MCYGKNRSECNACTGCNGAVDRAFEAAINGESVGSYEQSCIDFAMFGDAQREHEDYEFNAQFDRYDGWGDPGCADIDDYPCNGDCVKCNTGPVFVELKVPFNFAGSIESDVPF